MPGALQLPVDLHLIRRVCERVHDVQLSINVYLYIIFAVCMEFKKCDSKRHNSVSSLFFLQSLNYSYILITFHRSVLQYFIRWQKATFHLDLISIWFLILILKIICFLWLLIHHNSNLILVVGFCAFYRLHYCLFLYSIYICATYNTLSKVVVNLKCSINTVE